MATWTHTEGDGYYYNHMTLSGNAQNIKEYLEDLGGFTQAAIIGIIANAEHESYLNPGQGEHRKDMSNQYGKGLWMWTPARTKIIAYANNQHANWYDGDIQLDYGMISFIDTWQESQSYPYTWYQYTQLTDIYEATRCFFYNFERGTWHDELDEYARFWNEELYGSSPPLPPDPPDPPNPEEEDEMLRLAMFMTKMIR